MAKIPMKPPKDNPVLEALQYPILASPKMDGIRATVQDGVLLSYTLKKIPNRHLQSLFSKDDFVNLDGELIMGNPTDEDVYRRTNSAVMSHDGEPDVTFWVFDLLNHDKLGFHDRYKRAREIVKQIMLNTELNVRLVPHQMIHSFEELVDYENTLVAAGWEGAILRRIEGPYKYGRATMREGNVFKLKRFEDSEAKILDYEPEYHNLNDAKLNESGKTVRSKTKEGREAKECLGALIVQDIHSEKQFRVGIFKGVTREEREKMWTEKETLVDRIIKYQFLPVGVKDLPRHPKFVGFRDPIDISTSKPKRERKKK